MAIPLIPIVLISDLLFPLIIATRPPYFLRVLFVVYLAFITYLASTTSTGDVLQDYSLGIRFACQVFHAWYLVIEHDPIKEFKHELDTVPAAALPLWKRMWWAMPLMYSSRSVGWNVEERGIPPRPGPSRKAFIVKSLKSIFWRLLLVDLTQLWNVSSRISAGSDILSGPIDYKSRCIILLRWTIQSYGMLTLNYDALALFSVALGITRPQFWPNLYGKWSDAYTVRRFWGRTWHQMLRRPAGSTGKAAVRYLRCKPGSWQSNYVQLFVGFTVSGITHLVGDAYVDYKYTGYSLLFFLTQPFAYILEGLVISFASRKGIKESGWTHAIGYLWAYGWYCASTIGLFAWLLDDYLLTVLANAQPIPFSILRTAFKCLQYVSVGSARPEL